MNDEELETISNELLKKCVADSIGKAAVDPQSIEEVLSVMNRFKAILLSHLQIIDNGIAIINSFKNKGANNESD